MEEQKKMRKFRTCKEGLRVLARFSVVIFFAWFCEKPIPIMAATSMPSRQINVVYDDSGSMFKTGGELVDTWCQAKYAMEVFAAMLGEKDKMNVYYMSDYEKNTKAGPRIELNGIDGSAVNVTKIHDQKTVAGNTPFNSVKKAYADLDSVSADEKWLVILTDGEFQGVEGKEGIDKFLSQKPDDIKVMFLGVGKKADGITERQNQDIFYIAAETNNQILNSITNICTRIFNTNKLEINVSSKNFSFDVPMGELIVFTQGANVSLNGIKKEDGTLIQCTKTPVIVKYSECDASNYKNLPTTDLFGKIATFQDDFSVGNYKVDVSGAETIEIYYKPNIEVAVYLTDSSGNQAFDLSVLAAGEYTISFGFVKANTKEKVADSKLLGKVSYEAVVTNNGITHENKYFSGDKIRIDEGSISIVATAYYLDYNSVTTTLGYEVFKDKVITFSVVENPNYTVTSEGFSENEVIRIKAKIDGNEFTEEQWMKMECPQIALKDGLRTFKIDISSMEKQNEIGMFTVHPVFPNGSLSTGTYCDQEYQVTYLQNFGSETWEGSLDGILNLQDTRSWWEKNWDLFVKLVILGIILFILMGYLPFIKHYLPKSLKKKPYVKCIPSEPGEKRKDRNGVAEKNLISTIIPYIPQTGTIKYVPKGVTGCPALAVRAIKHRRMTLTNVKAFAGKDYITFDGEAIKKDVKKFETGAGVSIRVKRGEWTYVCSPNQSN